MDGIAADGPAIHCTGMGLLPWCTETGETIYVKCYYSAQAADTIISPTDVVINHITDFSAWSQYSNIDNGIGYIEFHRRSSPISLRYTLTATNGLWYHDGSHFTFDDYNQPSYNTKPIIHRMTQPAHNYSINVLVILVNIQCMSSINTLTMSLSSKATPSINVPPACMLSANKEHTIITLPNPTLIHQTLK
jgi:hypothetical protein